MRQASDVTDVRARNFFQRVFVVEIADHGGARKVAAHPCASWGHMESDGRSERFQPDEERAIGIPFVIGTASNLAMAFGSQTLADVIAAVDLSGASLALANGEAGAFELLPLVLLVLLPAALGTQRWRHREIG